MPVISNQADTNAFAMNAKTHRSTALHQTLRAGAAALLLLVATTAWALGLDEAKSRGLVGETPSGYLQAVDNPSADVKALVTRINGERRRIYQDIAAKRGTSLGNVEALAGKQAIDKSRKGEYVLVGGNWRKK